MDSLFSSILGELAGKFLSFLIDRCTSKPLQLPPEEKIQRLERTLLRLAATVEEAEGRSITNHAMLHQINMLRQDMHRGYYVLDTVRFLKDNDEVSYSSALSTFKFAKRARITEGSRRHGDRRELEQVLDSLDIAIVNMVEFLLLLNNYPAMHRQPYNTYLFMDKCMFGRQMEMEHVINFLLHPEPPNTDNIGVLPIIGPAKVGKSTFVEHVCYDERVRKHFSHIVFISNSDLKEQKSLFTLRDGGLVKHKHSSSSSASNGRERLLVVVELSEDVDEDEWTRMCSSRCCISAGSKIIITSRSEKISKLGTTQPLHLKLLSREAYWYFFKVLTFGSSDPKEHPEAASISMDMFNFYFDHERYKSFIGPFIDLSNMAKLIQSTAYNGSWLSQLRERIKAIQTESLQLLRDSGDSGLKSQWVFIPSTHQTVKSYSCNIHNNCRVGFSHEEGEDAPKIDIQDVLSLRVTPHGRLDVVIWSSRVPPYYSYIYSCDIHEYKPVFATCKMELRQKRKI